MLSQACRRRQPSRQPAIKSGGSSLRDHCQTFGRYFSATSQHSYAILWTQANPATATAAAASSSASCRTDARRSGARSVRSEFAHVAVILRCSPLAGASSKDAAADRTGQAILLMSSLRDGSPGCTEHNALRAAARAATSPFLFMLAAVTIPLFAVTGLLLYLLRRKLMRRMRSRRWD